MARSGRGIGRWVLAAILSTLAHGLVILAGVVIWSFWTYPTAAPSAPAKNTSGTKSNVFWGTPLPQSAHSEQRMDTKPLEVVPFTAQLSPLAMVSMETRPVEPVRKLLRDLRGSPPSKGLAESTRSGTGSSPSVPESAGWLATETAGERLAVLMDRSLSMGLCGGWNAARREAAAVLARVPPDCLMRVWLFDKTTEEIGSEGDWLPWTRTRSQRAMDRLEDTRPGGSTDLGNALRTAALRGASRIVVISDDADVSPGDWGAISTTLRRIGRPAPRLCAIRLGQQMRVDHLGDLCRQSGGWCRYETIR